MAVDRKVFYVKISSPAIPINHPNKVQYIVVDSNSSFRNIQNMILKEVDIDSKSHVVKVRNSNGSVFTLTGKVPSNTSDNPYTVEVLPCYYHHAKPLCYVNKDYLKVFVNGKLKSFTNRLEEIQKALPEYRKNIEERIVKNLQQNLKPTLDFLDKRLEQSNLACWEGRLRQSPLW
ncbi:uncharacterized protein LOC115209835 [Argonauta hians]